MSKVVNFSTKSRERFLKQEIAVVRELIADVEATEVCECDHCQPRVARRALAAYLNQLTSAPQP